MTGTRKVVITGYGVISPLGHTAQATWEAIKAGKSGVAPITLFDTERFGVKIAAEVKDFDPAQHIPHKEIRRRDRYQQFITVAAAEALAHSGLAVTDENRSRIAIYVGSAVGGVTTFHQQVELLRDTDDPRRVTPFGIPMLMVDGGADMVSIDIGATGPTYTMASACATGADCIGHAFDMIRLGRIDAALAGAGEAPIIPIGIAAFDRIGALSRLGVSRPFSKDRDGLVFSEGAGVLVLEELESAKRRGATIYAELLGYGANSDAFHITAPHPEATGAIQALKMAMQDAQVNPEDIDYINAHGTATQLNDSMETRAVKSVFGEQAYNIPMSSTKSMTGHGMGMTAAIEAVFSVQAIVDNVAPPTTNLVEPDPECDLDYVPNEARQFSIDCVMCNSFGFGGHNASLIFKRFV